MLNFCQKNHISFKVPNSPKSKEFPGKRRGKRSIFSFLYVLMQLHTRRDKAQHRIGAIEQNDPQPLVKIDRQAKQCAPYQRIETPADHRRQLHPFLLHGVRLPFSIFFILYHADTQM